MFTFYNVAMGKFKVTYVAFTMFLVDSTVSRDAVTLTKVKML